MSLISMKMLANMAYMQSHLRWCHVAATPQVWWINLKSLLLIVLRSSSDSNYVPNEHEDVDQYDPYCYAKPSEIMPHKNYPESLVNQNEIPVDLSC